MLPFSTKTITPLPLPWHALAPRQIFAAWLRSRWIAYAIGVVAMLITNLTEVAIPKITERIIDLTVSSSAQQEPFRTLLIALLLTLLAQALGRRYWRLSLGQETHRVAATLKESVWLRARYFPRHRLERDLTTGALMNVATGDVSNARLIFGWTLIGIFDFLFLTAFAAIAMTQIDPVITALAFVSFAALPALTFRAAQEEYKRHEVAQVELGRLNDLVAQAVSSIKLQRLSQSEPFWTERLMLVAERYRLKRLAVIDTMLRFIPLTGIPALLSQAILLLIAIPAVLDGSMSIGEFVALQGYIVLIQGPLSQMGILVSEWQRGRASLARVSAVLTTPAAPGFEEVAPHAMSHPPQSAVVFSIRNLEFRYSDAPNPAIQGFSLEIASGARIGITGAVGSGKTTFLQILAGNERLFQGEVLLHGRDIRSYSHEELSAIIALVEQRPFLFAETIRRNVLLNRAASDAEVHRFLEAAGLADDVARLPRGLETPLGEWGVNLSGGQKQRLTIARALAKNPQILLLDDCLSAVDVVTEEKILANLDRLLPNTTIIWVAHRLSTLRLCFPIVRFGT